MQGVCYIPIASCCTPPAGPARYTYISQGGMPTYRGKVYLRIAGCAPCSTLYPVRTHIPLLGCTVSCFIRPHTPSCMSLYTQAFTPAGKPPLPNRCLTYRSTCHMPHATCGFGDRERFRPHEGLGPLPKLFRTQSTQSLGHSDLILTSPCPSLARALVSTHTFAAVGVRAQRPPKTHNVFCTALFFCASLPACSCAAR